MSIPRVARNFKRLNGFVVRPVHVEPQQGAMTIRPRTLGLGYIDSVHTVAGRRFRCAAPDRIQAHAWNSAAVMLDSSEISVLTNGRVLLVKPDSLPPDIVFAPSALGLRDTLKEVCDWVAFCPDLTEEVDGRLVHSPGFFMERVEDDEAERILAINMVTARRFYLSGPAFVESMQAILREIQQ